MRPVLILGLAALAAGCGEKAEPLGVQRLADGGFRLTLETDALADAAEGQRLLLPAALQLCGAGRIRFGAYRMAATAGDGGGRVMMVQDIRCARPPRQAFEPGPADLAAVTGLSQALLDARAKGDEASARRLFAPGAADDAPAAAAERAFRRQAGRETRRAIVGVNWFDNPPAAPEPGVYAAVDFQREFEGVRLDCGFIIWRREPGGGFKAMRERHSHITREAARAMSSDALVAAKTTLGCR